jgi:cytochrome P450
MQAWHMSGIVHIVTLDDRALRHPLGAALTLDQLDGEPYGPLARLREHEPVSWVPVIDGWLVTRRDLCIEVMRDAQRFTVDDPRFSTAQVVGPSMLSLDGDEHRRHRDPFAAAFRRPEVMARFADRVDAEARRLVDGLAPNGTAEVRRELAGPLAVAVVALALELADTDPAVLLGWYDEIVAAVDRVSTGGEIGLGAHAAVDALGGHVLGSLERGDGMLTGATATLAPGEIVSNAAVMMFGGIETSEGMTTSLFWHLLTNRDQLAALRADRSLATNAIEESLRLEPAAARVDRYATTDVEIGGARIRRGDLVVVSLTAANRDPAAFEDPDRFDLRRAEARTHVTFAHGPHACVGLHLARLETRVALDAALAGWPGLTIDEGTTPPTGVIFRKPRTLRVRWDPPTRRPRGARRS